MTDSTEDTSKKRVISKRGIEDEMVALLAQLYWEDRTKTRIELAKECGLTLDQVKRVLASDRFKDASKALQEDKVKDAADVARVRLAGLGSKAVSTIQRVMDMVDDKPSDAVKAAIYTLQSLGIGAKEEKTQDASVTVVMPGASSQPRDIIVETENASEK